MGTQQGTVGIVPVLSLDWSDTIVVGENAIHGSALSIQTWYEPSSPSGMLYLQLHPVVLVLVIPIHRSQKPIHSRRDSIENLKHHFKSK